MAQLGEAIARYHKLFEQEGYRDLSWAEELQERMRQQGLVDSGRLVAPVLRPQFISRHQLEALTRSAEQLACIVDRIKALALECPALLNRLQMLPAEKMLAAVPSGYSRFNVTSRMEAQLQNGSLCIRGYETCNPKALAYSEPLADLFLDLSIVKTFKKGRYKLSKVGAAKRLFAAVLQAWKEFGGVRQPNIAVVEFARPFGGLSAEAQLLTALFKQYGSPCQIVSPENLEYSGGKLRAGAFEIDVVFRRFLTRELLAQFDLSHPLLAAYRGRAVCVVNDFRSELAQRKGLFDLLTDESVTGHLAPADRKLLRTVVPWTRNVSRRKTKYYGEEIDLPEFILRNRQRLSLFPNEESGDQRAFVGSGMNPHAWEGALRVALRVPYVVQERLCAGEQSVPLYQYGELQMKDVEVSIHPHMFNGKLNGACAALQTHSAGCSAPLGLAPVLVLEEN